MNSSYTFGIDGGGTRSRLAVVDEQGRRVFEASGGMTNLYAGSAEEVARNLRQLLETASKTFPLHGGCIGSAGLGRTREKEIFMQMMQQILPGVPLYLCSDGELLLVGGLASLEGYALISGTGSLALSRAMDGTIQRSGGYGYLLGDEGSAYWIAHQALARSLRSKEGRDLPSTMLPALLKACSLGKSEDLIAYVHHTANKADIANLAPLVTEFAIAKDPLALAILKQAVQELIALLSAVQNPEIRTNELVTAGGVLEHDPIIRPAFEQTLQTALPEVRIIKARGTALDGACLLSRSHVSGLQAAR